MGRQVMDVKVFERKIEAISKDITRSKQLLLDGLYQKVNMIQDHELLLSNLNDFKEVLSYFESEDVSVLESQLLNLQARAGNIHDLATRNKV